PIGPCLVRHWLGLVIFSVRRIMRQTLRSFVPVRYRPSFLPEGFRGRGAGTYAPGTASACPTIYRRRPLWRGKQYCTVLPTRAPYRTAQGLVPATPWKTPPLYSRDGEFSIDALP
ncbi:unnamed protein product, partial [Ectocarpus sp. 4 AP-2014]